MGGASGEFFFLDFFFGWPVLVPCVVYACRFCLLGLVGGVVGGCLGGGGCLGCRLPGGCPGAVGAARGSSRCGLDGGPVARMCRWVCVVCCRGVVWGVRGRRGVPAGAGVGLPGRGGAVAVAAHL